MNIKRTIKAARVEKNLNQKQLSLLANIGVNTLVKLEKGDYSSLKYPVMIRLCKVLDKSPDELFFNS